MVYINASRLGATVLDDPCMPTATSKPSRDVSRSTASQYVHGKDQALSVFSLSILATFSTRSRYTQHTSPSLDALPGRHRRQVRDLDTYPELPCALLGNPGTVWSKQPGKTSWASRFDGRTNNESVAGHKE